MQEKYFKLVQANQKLLSEIVALQQEVAVNRLE